MKLYFYITSLLMVLTLSSCDSKSTDPIDICVDAKIELYIQNKLSRYCSMLSEGKTPPQWGKNTFNILNEDMRSMVEKFNIHVINQHEERKKFCANPTINNFKKLDIRNTDDLRTVSWTNGEFPQLGFRTQCLEKFSK